MDEPYSMSNDPFWDIPSDDEEYWDADFGYGTPLKEEIWDIDNRPEPVVELSEWELRHKQLEADGWIEVKRQDGLVPEDVVYFEDTVWDKGSFPSLPIGSRSNTIKITQRKYDKNIDERITFEVIESIGVEALEAGCKRWKMRRTISTVKSFRKPWSDESERQKVAEGYEAEYKKLNAEWLKQKDFENENFLDMDVSKTVSVKEERPREIILTDLPDDEKQWILFDWYNDILLDYSKAKAFEKWEPQRGWKQLHYTNDEVVVGDIILFWKGCYSARYPHGKYIGNTMVIAKVTKIGRKYYYLEAICSENNACTDGHKSRASFDNIYYWGAYRLYWQDEPSRMLDFERKTKINFSTTKEYIEYVSLKTSDTSDGSDDIDNNCNLKKELKMIKDLNIDELNKQIKDGRNIHIDDEGYYKYSGVRNPVQKQVSNFILLPIAKVNQDGKWWFECKVIHSCENIDRNVILSKEDFQGSASLKRALSIDSRLEYYGNSQDTTKIQGMMTDCKPPQKAGTDKMGLHNFDGRWVYVEGHNALDIDGSTDKVVYTNNNVTADDTPCILDQPEISKKDLGLIAENLNKFNDPSITYVILGWIGFCFAKERLADKVNKRNPILLCQGEPSSGKTETITQIIQRIFSNRHPITNTADATKFTFAVNGSRSNMVPFHYDEWKKSVMQGWQIKHLESMLLSVFNQTTLPRGCTNQSINDYRFTAPLVISGEMTLESPSLRHRIFDVFFSKRKREGRTPYFKKLCDLPLESFGKGLLLHMLSISDEKLYEIFEQHKEMVDSRVDDRFEDNAALVRVGLWLIMDYLQANGIDTTSYNDGFETIDKAIVEMATSAKETNVDRVISDFSIMSHTPNGSGNWLNPGVHYEVQDGILSIKIAEAYARYQRYSKRHETVSELLGKSSLLQQMESKSYYIDKKTVRIGGNPCNAICLDLTAMPDFIEADFAA